MTQLIMRIINGELSDISFENRYNIAPTEEVPVLLKTDTGEWQLSDMRWWLVPSWSPGPSTKYTMFNAKSETLQKSRAFKQPFARQRCLIPASGYYEWRKEGAVKVPYLVQPEGTEGFVFAGLWDRWQRAGQQIDSCTIVTGAAPEAMKSLHHRVPIHLAEDEIQRWLNMNASAEELADVLLPHSRFPIRVTPLSSYVGNARNKDARCIEPLGDSVIIH